MQGCTGATERAPDEHRSGADGAAGERGLHAVAGLVSSVKQALEEGGCDELASARVLNLLEQDAVGRDLDSLRVLIELARSEKALAATQQLLAARDAEVASLSQRVGELLRANAAVENSGSRSALAHSLNETRAAGSREVQEELEAVAMQLQQVREDFEDKKVRKLRLQRAAQGQHEHEHEHEHEHHQSHASRSSALPPRASATFWSTSFTAPDCSCRPCTHCTRRCPSPHPPTPTFSSRWRALTALHQAKVHIAELLAGADLVLSGATTARCCRVDVWQSSRRAGADPAAVFRDLRKLQASAHRTGADAT
jgi:hypothetical protein